MIHHELDGDVAVIVIDNPPLNVGSTSVRRGLLEAIAWVNSSEKIAAAVLIGAGKTFISGSDIREFGKPLQAPELPVVISAIENSAKPFVAALEGVAFGGGYELALGCDGRIAATSLSVGLPEVTLGMIPGAGGTQRLPRLTGVAKAIALICGGIRVKALEAVELGMVDRIAKSDLRTEAICYARELIGSKRRVSEYSVPENASQSIQAATTTALKRGRNRPAVVAAIAAVLSAAERPFAEALAAERKVFTELWSGTEAAALRHLFFAERQAGRLPISKDVYKIRHIGVIGAGTMGAGIAAAILKAGLNVTLIDSNRDALARGQKIIEDLFVEGASAGKLDTQLQMQRGRLNLSEELTALASCDGIIEAIVEDLKVKTDLLEKLAGIVASNAIIASNTSYLDLNRIAHAVYRPERFVGLHFFNPPNVMRLLEVIRVGESSIEAMESAVDLARRLDKQPVIVRASPGFIGNRIYAAYRRQCEFLLEDGAFPEQIDRALEKFGFAMGPFATSDLSGLDIAWAMRKGLAADRDPAERYVSIADRLCEAGRFGRKSGAGWYAYSENSKRGSPDPLVSAWVNEASAKKEIVRRAFTDDEIVWRVLVTMLNEAALLLSEGVAERASDIDVVMALGYGFPRHEGGPLFWASRQNDEDIVLTLKKVESTTGHGFKRGDIFAVLDVIRKNSE